MICENIKKHRNNSGLTQKELSKALFMDERNYGKIERGNKKSIDIILLIEIANVLKVNIVDLLGIKKNQTKAIEDAARTESAHIKKEDVEDYIMGLKKDTEAILAEHKSLKEMIYSLKEQIKDAAPLLLEEKTSKTK